MEKTKIDPEGKSLLRRMKCFFSDNPECGRILNFLGVGGLGFICNLVVLTLLLQIGMHIKPALALGIVTSTAVGFFFNRYHVFSYAKHQHFMSQLLGFVFVCMGGALINYMLSVALLSNIEWMVPQLAIVAGAIGAATFNYIFLRLIVFKSS